MSFLAFETNSLASLNYTFFHSLAHCERTTYTQGMHKNRVKIDRNICEIPVLLSKKFLSFYTLFLYIPCSYLYYYIQYYQTNLPSVIAPLYWLKYLESPRTRVLLCRFSLIPKDWKGLHTNILSPFLSHVGSKRRQRQHR